MAKKPVGFLLGTAAISVPIPICEETITSLGRDESNSIVLDDLSASRRHAQVEAIGGAIYVTDLASTQGTFINDNKINPHEKNQLFSGQEIRIGGKVFFVISADAPLEADKFMKARAALSRKTTLRGGITTKDIKDELFKHRPVKGEIPKIRTDETGFSSAKTHVLPRGQGSKKPFEAAPTERRTIRPKSEYALTGAINTGGLPQIIQMIHTKRLSGNMKVSGTKGESTILFWNGDLYAAFSGRDDGEAAVHKVALEKSASFKFNRLDVSAVEVTPRNITRGTMQILMDCCCMIHEASGEFAKK